MQKLYDAGYIYQGSYEGWYCVGCEEYKDIVSAEGQTPECEVHQKPLEFVKEEIYYFALSRFQDRLIAAIQTDEIRVQPEGRKNEILSFLLNEPLRDIPVTRSKVAWGVSAPFAPDQTIYVWFDALLYYLSFSDGKSILEQNTGHRTWWPASLQLLGKDILRFHAVIWPAMLMALELPTPKELFVHGFFTINGQKMSKSLGNVIRPAELVARYGVDATRFLVLSAVPYGSDGDISMDRLDAMYTAHLANGIGNLLQRVISLINRYGIKPQISAHSITSIEEAYRANDISQALHRTNILVDEANRYIASTAPWSMENEAEREAVLVNCYQTLLTIAQAIVPVMPTVAEKMVAQLESLQPEPLFPRLDSKK
jgi:methionyl-tRNA synthetase